MKHTALLDAGTTSVRARLGPVAAGSTGPHATAVPWGSPREAPARQEGAEQWAQGKAGQTRSPLQ